MARKKRHSIDKRDGYFVVVMGDMEIWDGADLALLRETLAKLVDAEKRMKIGVDLSTVKYIPSGFFGMLYDYVERGTNVRVFGAQPHVRNMLWFREFFELQDSTDGLDTFQLCLRTQTSLSVGDPGSMKAPWATDDENPVPHLEPLPERFNPVAALR
jgi:hypothetical protein